MKEGGWSRITRRVFAIASLSLMVVSLVFPVVAVNHRWVKVISEAQVVPAILAVNAYWIILWLLGALWYGRIYCSWVCPLGVAQDLFRGLFSRLLPKKIRKASAPVVLWIRVVVLLLFVAGIVFGFTGFLEPYGIFGRFVTAGICRAGEPAMLMVLWADGLMALILALTLVRARWWCNRVCPVGTLLGLLSRFGLRTKMNEIDGGKCVNCGACAKVCDKGAIARREDGTIAVDHTECVRCYNCRGACPKGALKV